MPSLEAVYQSHEALADIVDGLLSWKFAASSTGSNTVQMPLASVHEIGVVTKLTMASNNSPVYLSKVIPDAFIDRDGTYSHFATRWGTAFDGDVVWVAYKQNGRTYIRLNNAYNGKETAHPGFTTGKEEQHEGVLEHDTDHIYSCRRLARLLSGRL